MPVRNIYQAMSPEKRIASNATNNLRTALRALGMTLADYDALADRQGNACAICGGGPTGNHARLTIDHDHETGRVRGLLCGACNTGLGHFGDDVARLRSAVTYLEVS